MTDCTNQLCKFAGLAHEGRCTEDGGCPETECRYRGVSHDGPCQFRSQGTAEAVGSQEGELK